MQIEKQPPLLNSVSIVISALTGVFITFIGLLVSVLAVLGVPYFYGGFIIDWIPYRDDSAILNAPMSAILNPSAAMLRFLVSLIPGVLYSIVHCVAVIYLTEGKGRAIRSIAIICHETLKYLKDPRLIFKSGRSDN